MRKAIRTTVVTFGVLAGLAGVEHGIGEILQGNVPPPGLVFESWPGSPAFELLSGEPAMTLIPNLRVTGILAVIWSLAFGAWAVLGAHKKHGGVVMIVLALIGLPIGAGFGPPLLGTIVGLTATRIQAPLERWRSRRRLGAAWPLAYGSALASWLLLCPGSIVLSHFLPASDLWLVPAVAIPSSFALLIVTIAAALARDAGTESASQQQPAGGVSHWLAVRGSKT